MPPSLANRLLFHSSPPPQHLFASQSLHVPELTAELYDFLALALRAYVNPWWSKITRYDRDLLPHATTHILLHLLRTLEARSAAVDWPVLVFHHLPAILSQHYLDYRAAHAKLATSYAAGHSLSALFAAAQPHVAFLDNDDDDNINPEYYRHVLDHLLAVCLPPDDYAPDAERLIVREVLLKVLLVDLIPKITQPWFIHKLLLDLLESSPPTPSHSSRNLVVVALSAIQALSGFCLALIHSYKRAIKLVRQHSHFYLIYVLQFFSVLVSASQHFAPSLILAIFFALSVQHHSLIDSLLPSLLLSHISSPAFLLTTTRTTKLLLFPNGYPGPPPAVPSPQEQQSIRNRLTDLWRTHPHWLATLLLGPDPTSTFQAAIDPLSDEKCNRRLVVFLLDSILAALVPELLTAPT